MALNDLMPWRGGRMQAMRDADHPFSSLQREMNRLMESFWSGVEPRMMTSGAMTGTGLYSPHLDVHETDQAYQVTAELPGLSESDVEINLRDNNLIIAGEKKTEHEEKHGDRHYSERSYGRFQRVIPFAVDIDGDKVQAKFDKGVLTVDLPKNAKARDKTRRIQINANQQASRH